MTLAAIAVRQLETPPPTAHFTASKYPQFIKYMGSKAKIIDFVVDGINEVYAGGPVCDIFAGAATLSGALGDQVRMVSNDIQSYSAVFARSYLGQEPISSSVPSVQQLVAEATAIFESHRSLLNHGDQYAAILSLEDYIKIEEEARRLIGETFSHDYHLFLKFYSGTWWSAEQCLWIDAFRELADRYTGYYRYFILACLMHSMAYCGHGTGHYAQYRDATDSSLSDILTYRRRSVAHYFQRKWSSVIGLATRPTPQGHRIMSVDYRDCLSQLEPCTVYADPPYCFVHYSRFYHAIETLVKYDYPSIQEKGLKLVKGRYRAERHQSPFSIRSQVPGAFHDLFEGVARSKSNLVLSYSNTGMIEFDELCELALSTLGSSCYQVWATDVDHKHMTMGRRNDRDREVRECLVLAKRRI